MADSLAFPDEGLNYMAEVSVGKRAVESIKIVPFVNDATIASTNTISDFTQMSTHDISAITLANASWGTASTSAGVSTSAYSSQQSFTAGATDDGTATNVYGIIAYGASNNKVLWSIKFDSAKVIQNTGDAISYTPEITRQAA